MFNIISHLRDANLTILRFYLTPGRMAIIKKSTNQPKTYAVGSVGKKEFFSTVDGSVDRCSHGNQCRDSSKH